MLIHIYNTTSSRWWVCDGTGYFLTHIGEWKFFDDYYVGTKYYDMTLFNSFRFAIQIVKKTYPKGILHKDNSYRYTYKCIP